MMIPIAPAYRRRLRYGFAQASPLLHPRIRQRMSVILEAMETDEGLEEEMLLELEQLLSGSESEPEEDEMEIPAPEAASDEAQRDGQEKPPSWTRGMMNLIWQIRRNQAQEAQRRTAGRPGPSVRMKKH